MTEDLTQKTRYPDEGEWEVDEEAAREDYPEEEL